jgi:hypothetical protein
MRKQPVPLYALEYSAGGEKTTGLEEARSTQGERRGGGEILRGGKASTQHLTGHSQEFLSSSQYNGKPSKDFK